MEHEFEHVWVWGRAGGCQRMHLCMCRTQWVSTLVWRSRKARLEIAVTFFFFSSLTSSAGERLCVSCYFFSFFLTGVWIWMKTWALLCNSCSFSSLHKQRAVVTFQKRLENKRWAEMHYATIKWRVQISNFLPTFFRILLSWRVKVDITSCIVKIQHSVHRTNTVDGLHLHPPL